MSYRNLQVYNQAYSLALDIHKLTKDFPKHELYEIGSQLRRAAISIPLNIAEGYGRRNYLQDFRKFLINALGSCNEVVVLLDMIKDLEYTTDDYHEVLKSKYERLGKQLNTFIQVLKKQNLKRHKPTS